MARQNAMERTAHSGKKRFGTKSLQGNQCEGIGPSFTSGRKPTTTANLATIQDLCQGPSSPNRPRIISNLWRNVLPAAFLAAVQTTMAAVAPWTAGAGPTKSGSRSSAGTRPRSRSRGWRSYAAEELPGAAVAAHVLDELLRSVIGASRLGQFTAPRKATVSQ